MCVECRSEDRGYHSQNVITPANRTAIPLRPRAVIGRVRNNKLLIAFAVAVNDQNIGGNVRDGLRNF